MVEKKEIFNEKDGWEKIMDMDAFWVPENIGDTVKGVYIQKEENVGRNHAEVFSLKENVEEGDPVLHKIFGTVGLVKKFKEICIGEEVGIIYKGEKASTPPKKPFKQFDVFKRKFENEDEDENNPLSSSPENNMLGDEMAIKWIDLITTDLLDEGIEPTEFKIKEKAKEYHLEKVEGLTDPKMLGRIEKQLQKKG
jgi:hypothetical protein